MPKTVVIDELHLTARVPVDQPDAEVQVIRRTLAGDEFMNQLRRAIRTAFRAFPELTPVRFTLTR